MKCPATFEWTTEKASNTVWELWALWEWFYQNSKDA